MHCYNCQTQNTPMWRRTVQTDSDTVVTLCNACGLYYKTKGSHRPTVLISKKNSLTTTELLDKIIQSNVPLDNKLVVKDLNIKDLNIIHCTNCQNINTSIWRKDNQGRNICNACGLYFKKKGVHRVVKPSKVPAEKDVFLEIDDNLIRFNRIKRRKRTGTPVNPNEKALLKFLNQGRSASESAASSISFDGSPTSTPPFAPTIMNQPIEYSPPQQQQPLTPQQPQQQQQQHQQQLTQPPFVLLPDNYRLTSSPYTPHNGNSIDQYHYDYSSTIRSSNVSYARSASVPDIQSQETVKQVTLPSISSILKI